MGIALNLWYPTIILPPSSLRFYNPLLGIFAVKYLFYPSNLAASEPYLDPIRMKLAVSQYIPDDTFCQVSGTLILLQNYCHFNPRFYALSIPSVHKINC